MNKRLLYYNKSIHILLICIFVVSIFTKLISYIDFNFFISTIVDDDELSLFISNTVIGIELFILVQLLLNSDISTYVLPIKLLLSFFIFISIYLLIFDISDNCYCFGNALKLNPEETIIKNSLLIILLKFYKLNEVKFDLKDIGLLIFTIVVINVNIQEPRDFFTSVAVEEISKKDIISINDYVFIDARPHHVYLDEHIDNAINIPFNYQLINNKKFREKLEFIQNTNKPIITYCDNDNCNLARHLALNIKSIYKEKSIYYLKEGIEKW